MTGKVKYKPRSWRDYNKSLIQRGNLSVWISDEVIEHWQTLQKGRRGAPRQYSDLAIKTML
jgi:recombinational DNA repair protein RecT